MCLGGESEENAADAMNQNDADEARGEGKYPIWR